MTSPSIARATLTLRAGPRPPTSRPPDAIQAVNAGSGGDAFISALQCVGAVTSVYSTFLGGNTGSETARGIALDPAGNIYVTGDTNSTNFPTAAPLQATRSGSIGTDAFVARIIGVPPTMSIDRRRCRSARSRPATAFTSRRPPQTVRLTQTGAGTVTWTATSTAPWLVVSPASGSGPATLTISAQFASGLTASQTGAISARVHRRRRTPPAPINVTLTVVSSTAAASPPFGSLRHAGRRRDRAGRIDRRDGLDARQHRREARGAVARSAAG